MTNLPRPNDRLCSWSAHFLAFTMAVAVLVMFILRPWINPTLFQSLLFLLGAAWAIALAIRPCELHFSLPMIPLTCAVAWGLLQLAADWTIGRADTWGAVLAWLGNLLAFFLAMQICASSRVRHRFLNTLLYFAFVLSVFSVEQYFLWNGKIFWLFPIYDAAAMGPFLNHGQYAVFIEMMLPLALVQALGRGFRSIVFGMIAAEMYATVIAGASRAGAVLATAEIVVIPLVLWAKGRVGNMRPAANVWMLAIAFTAIVGWAVLWARFEIPDPFASRLEVLWDTVAMVHARPWVGFGLGTFRTAYKAFGSIDYGAVVHHAHNDWAEWTADGGVPFSLFLVSIAIWTLPKALRSVWGLGIITAFVHGMMDFALQKPVLDLWMFALLGAVAAETRRSSLKPEHGLLYTVNE